LEFKVFAQNVAGLFNGWAERNVSKLKSLKIGDSPKELIETLSEDLLKTFENVRLIDKYDIYQYLMDYWTSTMQDDVYMIVNDGWVGNKDLLPPELVINRYFKAEQDTIDLLEDEKDSLASQKEEMEEEHSGEDGRLEELKNDNGRISKSDVVKRIKVIKGDKDFVDELEILNSYLSLIEQEFDVTRKIKEKQKILMENVTRKYSLLSEEETKLLVVDNKWMAILRKEIVGEVEKISQNLTGRVRELADRYAITLPTLADEEKALNIRVELNLKKMGFTWN